MKIVTSREQILPLVREWVEFLAQDKYEDAFDWLYRREGEVLNPFLLRQVIENYGALEPRADEKVFHITPLSSAKVEENHVPYQDIDWFEAKEHNQQGKPVGWVHFDLPLNGEMSDLTAIFHINVVDGGYVLQLESIDVL